MEKYSFDWLQQQKELKTAEYQAIVRKWFDENGLQEYDNLTLDKDGVPWEPPEEEG